MRVLRPKLESSKSRQCCQWSLLHVCFVCSCVFLHECLCEGIEVLRLQL